MFLYSVAPLIIEDPTFNAFITSLLVLFAFTRAIDKLNLYPNLKKKTASNKKYAYIILLLILIILSLAVYFDKIDWINYCLSVISTISLFSLLAIEISSFIPDYHTDKTTDKETKETEKDRSIIFLMSVGMLVFVVIMYSSTNVSLTTIDIEMEHISELDQTLIPIKVKVNGVNGDLQLQLFNNSSNYFSDKVTTVSFDIKKPYDVQGNKIISGTYLGDGKYEFYLNTTYLKADYYAIKIQSVRAVERTTFYLVNTK